MTSLAFTARNVRPRPGFYDLAGQLFVLAGLVLAIFLKWSDLLASSWIGLLFLAGLGFYLLPIAFKTARESSTQRLQGGSDLSVLQRTSMGDVRDQEERRATQQARQLNLWFPQKLYLPCLVTFLALYYDWPFLDRIAFLDTPMARPGLVAAACLISGILVVRAWIYARRVDQ